MTIVKGGYYHTDNTDLLINIVKVSYRSEKYFKAKIMLTNKYNKIFYGIQNYKVFYKDITHWKLYH